MFIVLFYSSGVVPPASTQEVISLLLNQQAPLAPPAAHQNAKVNTNTTTPIDFSKSDPRFPDNYKRWKRLNLWIVVKFGRTFVVVKFVKHLLWKWSFGDIFPKKIALMIYVEWCSTLCFFTLLWKNQQSELGIGTLDQSSIQMAQSCRVVDWCRF